MRNTADILNEAYQLIETGDLAQARQQLQPLLASDAQNPDVWWLYAHAVEDPVEGQAALERVLALSPSYPGATELLAQSSPQPRPTIKPLRPASAPPVLPEGLPSSASTTTADDDFGDFEEAEMPQRRRAVLPLVAVLIIGLIVVGLLLFALNQQGTPSAPATSVVQNPTTDATATVDQNVAETPMADNTPLPFLENTEEAMPTLEEEATSFGTDNVTPNVSPQDDATPTQELSILPEETTTAPVTADSQAASGTDFTTLSESITTLNVPASSITTRRTSLGATVVVDACEIPGPNASALVASLMESLAQFDGYGDEVMAVGVSVADCTTGSAPRIVAIDATSATAYRTGAIDSREFQRRWQPVDEEP